MQTTYLRVIRINPVVPYAIDGYHKSHWCNAITLSSASVKQFQIAVFANSVIEVRTYAERLKRYLEKNPIGHDHISIGLRSPVLDPLSQAYKIEMVMITGNLYMGSRSPSTKPHIGHQPRDCDLSVGTKTADQYDVNGLWYYDCNIFKT